MHSIDTSFINTQISDIEIKLRTVNPLNTDCSGTADHQLLYNKDSSAIQKDYLSLSVFWVESVYAACLNNPKIKPTSEVLSLLAC